MGDVAALPLKSLTTIIRNYFLVAFAVWTGIIAAIFIWDAGETRQFVVEEAKSNAVASYNKDVAFREWATTHGGVYVPVDEVTQPNTYLTNVKERDIITPSGKHLTLMNPAFMARQMNEFFAQKGNVFGHITSLNLKNPINKPDKWEEDALRAFEKGERERVEVTDIGGKPFLRLIRPMVTKEGCLKCHADQGYKVGDIRGGVGVSLGLEQYYAEARALTRKHAAAHGLIWLLGSLGLLVGHGYARRLGRARDETREALVESEERFRQLSQASFEGVAIHAEGIILDCNAAYAAMMGYEPSAVIGLPVLATVAPEFREEIQARMKQGYDEPFETWAVKKDGARFPVEAFGRNIVYKGKDARISVLSDLTKRKKAEEALKKNEALLNQTQQISSVGGWEYDVSSGKILWTEETYRIHEVGPDFDPNDLHADFNFYAPSDRAVIENAFKRAVELGAPYDLELQLIGARETGKWVRTYAQVEWIGGKVTRVFGNIIDITERKQAEMELVAAKEAAEEANRLKSEFLSNMTHELNTPLTSVLGYYRLANDRERELAANLARIVELMDPADNAAAASPAEARLQIQSAIETIQEIAKYDNIVLEQGQRLFSLLNDLMDLSRLESGHMMVEERAVSTFMLLTTIERYYKDPAMMKGLAFSDNAAEFRPNDLLFIGDRKWLEKALGNLVQNAIKFSDAGKIRVTASRDGTNIFFRVSDEGIGIQERERGKLFETFRQLDGSSTRTQGGVGLGLIFARKLVQAMGGDISVQSEAGKGSEFIITIPYRPVGSNPGNASA